MSPPFPADVPNWCQIYGKSPAGKWCQPTSLCQTGLVNQWDICSRKCVNKPSVLSSSLVHGRSKRQSLQTSQVMSKPKQRCVFLQPGVFLLDIRGRYTNQQQTHVSQEFVSCRIITRLQTLTQRKSANRLSNTPSAELFAFPCQRPRYCLWSFIVGQKIVIHEICAVLHY